MNIYEKQRTEMHWKAQRIKDLATPHIYNIIGVLKKSKKTYFGAYPKDTWIKALNEEIEYRDKLGRSAYIFLTKKFPAFRSNIKNQLKLEI